VLFYHWIDQNQLKDMSGSWDLYILLA